MRPDPTPPRPDPVVLPTPTGHWCPRYLPHHDSGYGSTGCADGNLTRCPLCGRWWVSLPCYESYGPTSRWYPVRWWHRRLRRRINAYELTQEP